MFRAIAILCVGACFTAWAKPNVEISSGSARVVVGKDFSLPANQHVDSLVVIGSTGTVGGSVDEFVAVGSRVEFLPSSTVAKNLVNIGSEVIEQPGSQISTANAQVHFPFDEKFWESAHEWDFPQLWWPGKFVWVFFTFLAALALGYLYLHLAPRFNEEVRQYLNDHSIASFLAGMFGQLLILPGAFLLAITLVGIPLLPLYGVAIIFLLMLGYLSTAFCIGTAILRGPSATTMRAMAAGLAILAVIKLIPLVGGPMAYLALSTGFGAVLYRAYQRIRERG